MSEELYEMWLEFLDDHPQVKDDWLNFIERRSNEESDKQTY